MRHAIKHAVVQEVLGALKAFGKRLADRLLYDPRTGKADERIGFRNVNVAKHGV